MAFLYEYIIEFIEILKKLYFSHIPVNIYLIFTGE